MTISLFQLPRQDACRGATTTSLGTPNNPDSAQSTGLHQPALCDASRPSANEQPVCTGLVQSSTPRDALPLNPKDARDLNRPQQQAEYNKQEPLISAVTELTTPSASPSKEIKFSGAHDETYESIPQPGRSRRSIARDGISRNGTPHSIDYDCRPPLSDFESAGYDTSSAERDHSPSPLSGRLAINLEEDTVEGAKEDDFDSPDRTLVNYTEEVFSGVNELRAHKHRRNSSMVSVSSITRKPSSVTIRAQSKTSGGFLELRASAARLNGRKATRMHRRNVSLNLPIRPISSQLGDTQHTQTQPSASRAPTPEFIYDKMSTAAQIESELQYKHRHVFVGTASLHSFLETLETSPLDSTTKSAVMKAFTILASKEQLMVRQRSSSPEDWNLVTRITADISEFDYITLARVQLGSVSLQHFVDSIPFDTHDAAPTVVVVEAFKNASHMDTEEGCNARSKARAFRTWFLSQSGTVE